MGSGSTDNGGTSMSLIERVSGDGFKLTPYQVQLNEEHKARRQRLHPVAVVPLAIPKIELLPQVPDQPAAALERQFKDPWFTIEEVGPAGLHVHSITAIQRIVCKHFGITMAQMTGQRRHTKVVRPRQVAMYFCRQLTERSWPDIGRRFGGKDHTTVLAAIRRIEKMMTESPEFNLEVNQLRRTVEMENAQQRERMKAACADFVDKAGNSTEAAESIEAGLI